MEIRNCRVDSVRDRSPPPPPIKKNAGSVKRDKQERKVKKKLVVDVEDGEHNSCGNKMVKKEALLGQMNIGK